MQGFRTLAIAALLAMAPAIMTWITGFDWTNHIVALGVPKDFAVPLATAFSGLLMAGMRLVTTTPTGKAT